MSFEFLVIIALGLLVVVLFVVVVPPDKNRAWAIVFTLATLMVTGNNSVPRGPRIASFAFCSLILLVSLLRGGSARRRPPTSFWPVLLIWGGLAIGVFINRSYPLESAVLYFGTAVLVAFVTSTLSSVETRLVLTAFVAMASIESLWGLLEVLSSSTPLWGFRGNYIRTNPLTNDVWHRAQASTGQPVVFGTITGLGALLVWVNGIKLTPRLRLAALAVTGTGVFVSGTRSVALCLVIAILAHLLARQSLLRWFRNVFVVGVIAGVVVVFNFGLTRLAADLVDSGSWVHRFTSIEGVPNLLARPLPARLFGSGFGSQSSLFQDGYIRNTYGLQVVDNYLVYLLGTSGLVGLIMFLVISAVAIVRSDAKGRVVILLILGMALSFDLLVWFYMGIVLSFFYALPSRGLVSRRNLRTSRTAPIAPVIPRDQRLA